MKKPERHHLKPVMGQINDHVILIRGTEEDPAALLWYSCQKNRELEYDHEKTSDKPKLRDTVQNKWPVHFKNVKVTTKQNKKMTKVLFQITQET